MKFTSYKNWLMEKEKTQSKKLDYGCVMLYTDLPDWNKRLSVIKKEDIYNDEFNDFGLEHEPHVTLLFGIHLDQTNPNEVVNLINTFKPIEVIITEISTFTGEEYDVVKYDVPVVSELRKYHEIIKAKFPNTQTFPEYQPHMTLGYVLPKTGVKYIQKVKPFKVLFDTAVYSYVGEVNQKIKTKVKLQSE